MLALSGCGTPDNPATTTQPGTKPGTSQPAGGTTQGGNTTSPDASIVGKWMLYSVELDGEIDGKVYDHESQVAENASNGSYIEFKPDGTYVAYTSGTQSYPNNPSDPATWRASGDHFEFFTPGNNANSTWVAVSVDGDNMYGSMTATEFGATGTGTVKVQFKRFS